jgi:hypothetical protein
VSLSNKFQVIFSVFLFLLYGLLISQKINLVTADLGRHLKNGEIFINELSLPKTNFYSYTYPDYPFINHHWGSGVVFYLIQKAFGFTGLSILFVAISLATFWLFFDIARKSSRFSIAVLVSVVAMPILATRTEIRPEIFSYFFCGLFVWLLWHVKHKLISQNYLYLIPLFLLTWINLHIYFFLGFFILGIFLLGSFIDKTNKGLPLLLIKVGLVSAVLVLLNPAGIKGIIYPLQIFNNFGYMLFENQGVLFLDKLVKYSPSQYFKISFVFLAVSWVLVLVKKQKFLFENLVFTIFFSYLGWSAVRNFTVFGLFAVPIISANLSGFIKRKEDELEHFTTASLAVVVLLLLFLINIPYWSGRLKVGWGLKENNLKAADFFLKEGIKDPVFNNYDSGGYLIYSLYPQKVFVDNRPEAYPASFFKEIYIPSQENETKWGELDKKHNFNSVFFYRLDLTPWGQTFLVNRVKDPSWAPVYVDDLAIIFVKRNEENKDIIQKHELPKEMFSISR